MAAQSQSRWRQHSRNVITAVLADLARTEPDATAARKRAALRAAYPFGERAMHPYKCWCKEVARVLGPAQPRKVARLDVTWDSSPPPLVVCQYCYGRTSGGCIACAAVLAEVKARADLCRELAAEAVAWEGRMVLLATDWQLRGVFGDWLEEHGLPALGAHWRKEGERLRVEAGRAIA